MRRQVEGKIDVLVPCGTTGEAVTMSAKENERVVALTLEESKGTPVLAGAGSNDTHAAIERAKAMAALGAPDPELLRQVCRRWVELGPSVT